jgi:hypothetical protein
MYVGHYAVGIATASVRPRRGVLAYLTLAAIAPDLPMSIFELLGEPHLARQTHLWPGLACAAIFLVALGAIGRLHWCQWLLALGALASHKLLDRPVGTWLYAHRWVDLGLEVGMLVGAALLFQRRRPIPAGTRWSWWLVCGTVIALQLVWDVWILGGEK